MLHHHLDSVHYEMAPEIVYLSIPNVDILLAVVP
jgi:hypothetical protein